MKIKETMWRRATRMGHSCHVILPKTFVGEMVQLSFIRKLTDEEIKTMEISKLISELKKIRAERKKKIKGGKRNDR